jgi:hypothetical protein
MKLRTQIDRLLATANSDIDSDAEMRMLIEIVARRDALFVPWRTPVRDPICQRFAAIRQKQVDYLSGARGVNAKASGRSEWKDFHHVRNGLIARAWAIPTTSGGQTTSLLITELGDAIAQLAISKHHTTVEDAAIYLAMIRRYGSLSESTLLQRELIGDPTQWASLSEMMLPLLVRGLIVASSDSQGRLFYSAGPGEPTPTLTVNQAVLPWAFDAYFAAYHAERLSLESVKHDGGEVFIPIPAGHAAMKTFAQLEDSQR